MLQPNTPIATVLLCILGLLSSAGCVTGRGATSKRVALTLQVSGKERVLSDRRGGLRLVVPPGYRVMVRPRRVDTPRRVAAVLAGVAEGVEVGVVAERLAEEVPGEALSPRWLVRYAQVYCRRAADPRYGIELVRLGRSRLNYLGATAGVWATFRIQPGQRYVKEELILLAGRGRVRYLISLRATARAFRAGYGRASREVIRGLRVTALPSTDGPQGTDRRRELDPLPRAARPKPPF